MVPLIDLTCFGLDMSRINDEAMACADLAVNVRRDGPGPGSLLLTGGLNYRVADAATVEEFAPYLTYMARNLIPAVLLGMGAEVMLAAGPRSVNINELDAGQDMEWHIDGLDLAVTVSFGLHPGTELEVFSGGVPHLVPLDPGHIAVIPRGMPHRVPPHKVPRTTLVAAYVDAEPGVVVDERDRLTYQYGNSG